MKTWVELNSNPNELSMDKRRIQEDYMQNKGLQTKIGFFNLDSSPVKINGTKI